MHQFRQCHSTVTAKRPLQIVTTARPFWSQLNKLVRATVNSAYQQITVYQCSGRDRPTQLHSREQAHSERYLSFRLSGKPSNTSRRTTRYMLRKENTNVPLGPTTTESQNAGDKRNHGPIQRYQQSNADCQNSQHSRR